jgi:hypothetical protein
MKGFNLACDALGERGPRRLEGTGNCAERRFLFCECPGSLFPTYQCSSEERATEPQV